jgi:hypothetical protein
MRKRERVYRYALKTDEEAQTTLASNTASDKRENAEADCSECARRCVSQRQRQKHNREGFPQGSRRRLVTCAYKCKTRHRRARHLQSYRVTIEQLSKKLGLHSYYQNAGLTSSI